MSLTRETGRWAGPEATRASSDQRQRPWAQPVDDRSESNPGGRPATSPLRAVARPKGRDRRVAPMMTPASGWARLRAFAWDFVVIVGWIATLTTAGFVVRARLPSTMAVQNSARRRHHRALLLGAARVGVPDRHRERAFPGDLGQETCSHPGGWTGWRPSRLGMRRDPQRGQASALATGAHRRRAAHPGRGRPKSRSPRRIRCRC
jgi:hypothetical protein